VHGKGLVKVTVPDGYQLPDMTAGDEISLTATVESDGSFTLQSLDDEDASDDTGGTGGTGTGDGGGVDMGDNWFTVAGVVDSLSADSVSVDVEGHDAPVKCSIPADVDVSDFAEGDFVLVARTAAADGGSEPRARSGPGAGDPAAPRPRAHASGEGVPPSIR